MSFFFFFLFFSSPHFLVLCGSEGTCSFKGLFSIFEALYQEVDCFIVPLVSHSIKLNGEKAVGGIKGGFNVLQSVICFDSFNMFIFSTCL